MFFGPLSALSATQPCWALAVVMVDSFELSPAWPFWGHDEIHSTELEQQLHLNRSDGGRFCLPCPLKVQSRREKKGAPQLKRPTQDAGFNPDTKATAPKGRGKPSAT